MKKIKYFFLISFLCLSATAFSQQIVYKPVSVFFGGDAFSYQQVLASANAQNDFQKKNSNGFKQPTDIENFTSTLNRQLLNSLSQSLFQSQIGSASDLGVGTYVFGSLVVEVSEAVGGLSVNILNTSTGEQTQITVPST